MKDVGVDREAREAEGHECMVSWKTVEAAFQESRGITMRQCWEVKENEHQELNTGFGMHMSLVTPTNVILVKHWGVGNGFFGVASTVERRRIRDNKERQLL